MKDIIIKKYHSEEFVYTENELNNLRPIIEAYMAILSDGRYNKIELEELTKPVPPKTDKAYEKLQLIHYMMELLTEEAEIFILEKFDETKNKNIPAAMALYTKMDNSNQYLLEFVETRQGYQGCNFAQYLLKESFYQLKELGALAIHAHVNINNKASINLNESLGTIHKAIRTPAHLHISDGKFLRREMNHMVLASARI